MNRRHDTAGFSLLEVLISMSLLGVASALIAAMLLQNSRVNKEQLRKIEVQSSARTSLSMVVPILRTAGWDPRGLGLAPVVLDTNLADSVNYIQVFADLNADGDTDDTDENVTIRHANGRIEWRRTGNVADPFEVIGVNITNDADGNGSPELMFIPDATPNPTRLTVRITAAAPAPGSIPGGDDLRYTVSSDVLLRNAG